jgi:hypothetical protein
MDARKNPYAPGAGNPPPELAGRDDLVERAAVALDRIRDGKAARSLLLYGVRGVGKTVLLHRISIEAEGRGLVVASIEAPEGRSLPALLAPALRATLLRLDRSQVKAGVRNAMQALANFVRSLKLKYQDVEISIDSEPVQGVADSGDLELDLIDLFVEVGNAARGRKTAVVLSIDELQYVQEEQFAALIAALHHTAQRQLPIAVVGAGLPNMLGQAGRAKSYAERLFEFVPIDRLDDASATRALVRPAGAEGVKFTKAAVAEILRQTSGYPYFLQEWGKHAWAHAEASPIAEGDAKAATVSALAELDASFFRVRFDRLTPTEKRFLRAMAELGPGPHRSGDVARQLGKAVTTVAPVRASLIEKGMIHSPAHGENAFTVPLFDGFMKRIMPSL